MSFLRLATATFSLLIMSSTGFALSPKNPANKSPKDVYSGSWTYTNQVYGSTGYYSELEQAGMQMVALKTAEEKCHAEGFAYCVRLTSQVDCKETRKNLGVTSGGPWEFYHVCTAESRVKGIKN